MEKYFKEAMKIIKAESKRNKISKLKKSKIKEFIRNIFKNKNEKGKNTNIVLYDELHSYKENEMCNNIIAISPEEHYRNNTKNEYLYKAEYMQNPFDILTEDNLERLEKHCKKAIYYERGEIKKEHEVTLCLLYRYKEQQEQIEKKNKIIDYMSNFINDNTPYTKDTRELENERGVRNIKYTIQYFERKVKNEES